MAGCDTAGASPSGREVLTSCSGGTDPDGVETANNGITPNTKHQPHGSLQPRRSPGSDNNDLQPSDSAAFFQELMLRSTSPAAELPVLDTSQPPNEAEPAEQPGTVSPSLVQLRPLWHYLQQCDGNAEALQVLPWDPPHGMAEAASCLLKRACWLSLEEAEEYKRAKRLRVLSPEKAAAPSLPRSPPILAADVAECERHGMVCCKDPEATIASSADVGTRQTDFTTAMDTAHISQREAGGETQLDAKSGRDEQPPSIADPLLIESGTTGTAAMSFLKSVGVAPAGTMGGLVPATPPLAPSIGEGYAASFKAPAAARLAPGVWA